MLADSLESTPMSGNLLILIELGLVFGVAFGWGLNELRQLKKYKQLNTERNESASPSDAASAEQQNKSQNRRKR
jgi:hypothetical protein